MNIQELKNIGDNQLTQEELYILILSDSMSYQEIGDKLGYTKQNVSYLMKRAKSKLEKQGYGG